MRFDLSDDQRELQSAVRGFVARNCPLERVLAGSDEDTQSDVAVWQGLMDLGIGGIVAPEEYGGLGCGVLDLAVALEPLGYGVVPAPVFGHVLSVLALVRAGSDGQRDRWLGRLVEGSVRAAVIWDQADVAPGPGAGLRLDLLADGVLDAHGADLLVVCTADGLALAETSGAQIERQPGVDRTRSVSTVRLNGHPAEPLSGGAGIAGWLRDVALTLLAADAMGGADRCVGRSVDYVKVREQWGVPVGSFQAVKHQLADLALAVEPARGLYWYAAHLLDGGPSDNTDAARAASLAKAHLSERFVEAGRGAVELHGGVGYTWEYGLGLYLRRALVDRAYLGDPRTHRARFAELSGWGR